MKIFKINKRVEIVCNSESTRYGFRHLATLFVDGVESANTKCTYQNRTWESYEFQSVLHKVISISQLSKDEKTLCNDYIDNYKESNSGMKTTAMVASLGEIFCDNKKDKNDWKKRMLKAGLENQGLDIPEDWENLSEDEKESRLNKTIEFMKND